MSVRRQDADTTPRPLRSEYVTGNYFSTLGVSAFAGRVFTAADDAPAAPPAVVLAYHLWQGTYGGDPALIGATLFPLGLKEDPPLPAEAVELIEIEPAQEGLQGLVNIAYRHSLLQNLVTIDIGVDLRDRGGEL